MSMLQSLGLLILRLSYGAMMLYHGIPKLRGFSEMAESFADPIGLGSRWSLIATIGAEVGCSVLIMVGLLTRLASLSLAFTMGVAMLVVHANDDWSTKEKAALYLAVYVTLLLTGPGKFSVDHLLFGPRDTPAEELLKKAS